MKTINTQTIFNEDLAVYQNFLKLNKKSEDTYVVKDSIRVLTSVFPKLVSPVSIRQ